ncbi:P-loop containing nucleoside triphosphate hydrolase protein [Microdochium bolleyi]|uniref:p-loop containing nucleoside triphosphate hydrolase protein n=1 Tax=Microdochium bolleyi TaxID=196109 RepID=A0A136IVH3_9PEZI|nr:P-loop containing nucleoside triphosphate hydrolase protein [Microdochium bolleyi]
MSGQSESSPTGQPQVGEKPQNPSENNDGVMAVADSNATKVSKKEPSRVSQTLRGLFRYFRLLTYGEPTNTDIALLIGGTVFAIIAGIPFPLLGVLLGQVIDDLNAATCGINASAAPSPELQQSTNQKIIYVVVVGLVQFTCVYVHTTCWCLFGDRLAHRLREKYFRSILRQEVSYFDKLPAGEVSSRLSADIATIKSGTSEKVGTYIGVSSMFVTAYIIAFIKDARLAGMLLFLLPAFMLMTWVGGHFVSKHATSASESLAGASSVAMESLSNVMVVHAFRANDRLESKFASSLEGAKTHGIKKATAAAFQSGLLYFLAFSASALAYWKAGQTIADTVAGFGSGNSVGNTYTVIFLLVDASLILSQISPFLQFFASASGALEKLEADMDRPSQIDGTADSQSDKIENFTGAVRLEKVHFNYPSRPDVKVIQDVTLDFQAGQHTAIVGLSGSGKSTIAGLVTRLYDPLEGSVSIDGHDLKNVNVRHLRSFIGLVQQDPLLLDRSLLENIALGLVNSSRPEHDALQKTLLGTQLEKIAEAVRSGKDLEEAAREAGPEALDIVRLVQHAADLADADIFLGNLEFGFGTLVGSNGDLLSGGQKQRVALARALVKDPNILVLDEATSSLDSASELRIQSAIENATKGRTVISIAHRLATVRNADKIVVMRNGKVIEQGSHFELLAKDADYAALVRLQSIGSETSSTTTARNSKSLDFDPEKVAHALKVRSNASNEKETSPAPEDKPASEKDDETTTPRPAWQSIKSMGSISRPYVLWIVVAMLAAAVVGGTYSGSAVIFGNIIGALSPCNTPDAIRMAGSFFGLMFFVLAVVEFFANGISWSFFGAVAERVLYKIRILTFRSLFEQDLQWHQSKGRTPSGLLTFLTTDSASIGALTGSIIGTIFSIAINFLAAIILSHVVAWKIAIVCLATVPLMLGAGMLQMVVQSRFNERHEKAFEKSVGITVEAVNSIKTVAALSIEHEVMNTYRRALDAPRKEFTRSSIYSNFYLAIAFSMNNFIYALLYWWGSTLIGRGEYTQTQFFIVLIALLVSAQLWGSVFTLSAEVTRAGRAVGRIFDLIDLGSTKSWNSKNLQPRDTEAAVESKRAAGTVGGGMPVKFNNVHFSYPARPGREVLKGLDLDIRAGQFCALVGPSGAGKSTIVSLLERMYQVSSGSIEVDGLDVTAKSEPLFRDDIGLVPQDSVLFEGTIRFNIALGGRPGTEPTDAEIEQACKLANIHETIVALPQGYDTNVGPNGGQLSGGQRQRLSIARALVRRPRMLLLDESTSALDAESERLLQDGLEKAARGITVVAIAHRLHTIRRADVIFLVEDGRCVDRGSHEELLERSESYRVNVMHQTLDG